MKRFLYTPIVVLGVILAVGAMWNGAAERRHAREGYLQHREAQTRRTAAEIERLARGEDTATRGEAA